MIKYVVYDNKIKEVETKKEKVVMYITRVTATDGTFGNFIWEENEIYNTKDEAWEILNKNKEGKK